MKEKGYGEYDMSYDYEGTTIDGIDAAWCDNIADTKVYSESEFDLINLDKELSFIEKGEPYISVPFTEGSSSDYKHCHIEGGTIYGFKDGIGLTTLQKSPVVIQKQEIQLLNILNLLVLK